MTDPKRLVKVSLDDASMAAASRDAEHERAVAIYDLIEENSFAPLGHDGGLSPSLRSFRLTGPNRPYGERCHAESI